MYYIIPVTFQEWINRKYIEWRGDRVGRSASITKYAEYIGVTQQVMDYWINQGNVPKTKKAIDRLISRYDGEVYDILDLEIADVELLETDDAARLIKSLRSLPPEVRPEVTSAILRAVDTIANTQPPTSAQATAALNLTLIISLLDNLPPGKRRQVEDAIRKNFGWD